MGKIQVLIVGGSVAGLTLANILEAYGIDFMVLEKYPDIAPQVGASIGILPHGARILDQLGIFTQIEAVASSVSRIETYGPNGSPLKEPDPIGEVFENLVGYRMQFLERRQLLQILYDNLKDKSKVQTSADVCGITQLNSGIEVILKDGRCITGDLVVGADGVHSPLRSEMWRIADAETQDYNSDKLKQSIQASYKCLFGTAECPEGMPEETLFKSYHQDRSYLCATAPDNKFFFLLFVKMPEVSIFKDIPRYTKDDAKNLAAEFAGDVLFHGAKFGDICKSLRMDSLLVPVEEYVLEKCFYKRAVLIGDSFHKVNPLSGHGGNSAIESAALLADLLKSTLDENLQPSNDAIQRMLSDFQEIRTPRAKFLMESTRQLQKMEGLEDPLRRFMTLNVTSKLGAKSYGPIITRAATPGRSLKHFSNKYRHGAVAIDEAVVANPKDRPKEASLAWIYLMLSVALSTLAIRNIAKGQHKDQPSGMDALHHYNYFVNIAINSLWVVESYRSGLLLSPLLSGTPFVAISALFGWEIALQVYFILYIAACGGRPFYYPLPRAIDPAVVNALPIGVVLTYIPLAYTLNAHPQATNNLQSILIKALPLTHLGLPVIVYIAKSLYGMASQGLPLIEYLYGTKDMKGLARFYSLIILISSTAHAVFLTRIIPQAEYLSFISIMIAAWPSLLKIISITMTIVVWCAFTAWDLRRVNLTKISPIVVLILSIVGSVILGPGSVLAALWMWREQALQHGRTIKPRMAGNDVKEKQ